MSLASDGLVKSEPVAVPSFRRKRSRTYPESYSARRALGHLIIGSAANWQADDREPASDAFDSLLNAAEQRDIRATTRRISTSRTRSRPP